MHQQLFCSHELYSPEMSCAHKMEKISNIRITIFRCFDIYLTPIVSFRYCNTSWFLFCSTNHDLDIECVLDWCIHASGSCCQAERATIHPLLYSVCLWECFSIPTTAYKYTHLIGWEAYVFFKHSFTFLYSVRPSQCRCLSLNQTRLFLSMRG